MMGGASFSAIYHILRGTAGDKTVLASGKLQTLQNGKDQDCLRLKKNSTLRDIFLFQYSPSNSLSRPHKLSKDMLAFNLIVIYSLKVGNSTKH